MAERIGDPEARRRMLANEQPAKRKPLPKRIYVERWDDEREDSIHYEPTGYGVDLRGNTSRIYVYQRVTQIELRAEKKKAKSR
jgi:hypothetical protein